MSDLDLDEGHVNALHYARFAEAVEEAGVEHASDLPRETIHRLQEQSQRDWIAYVAKRDGKKVPTWNDTAETDVEEDPTEDSETEEIETEESEDERD